MAEVFTISGAESYEMNGPSDQQCASRSAPVLVAGGLVRIGAVPLGLFGTYKLFKANWAAGVTSMLGAGIMWFFGGKLVNAALKSFDQCRHQPPGGTS